MSDLYDEIIDAMAVLAEMAEHARPDDPEVFVNTADRWRWNVEKWGKQPIETLYIVLSEEVGEIARAILEADDE